MDNKGFTGDAGVADGGGVAGYSDPKMYDGVDTGITIPATQKGVALRPYPGMGKEDLLRFSQTPFWIRFRLGSLIAFWIFWLGLLVAIVAITIAEDRCDDFPEPRWWQSGSFYNVYMRSYQDSDGDGYGDIQGVLSRLDHIQSIHANTIVFSSFYESHTDGDYGYDVTNHMDLNREAGRLADFRELVAEAHSRGMQVVVEFIPNHTGTEHEWFAASRQDDTNENWNQYVWADGPDENTPPNNWRNVYDDPAWTFDILRGQWYLHQYLNTQPDLNLRSTKVQSDLEDILRFWLDEGVDGILVNSASLLYESTDLLNEPILNDCGFTNPEERYKCLNHVYTRNQPENIDIIARWRRIVDEYSTSTNTRVLIADLQDSFVDVPEAIATYYGHRGNDGAHLVLNYGLTHVTDTCDGACVLQLVDDWLVALPTGADSTGITGTHSISRLASNLGEASTTLQLMLVACLPGAMFTYYGDEIGMQNGSPGAGVPIDPAGRFQQLYNRDGFRSPMQWTSEMNSGFMSNQSAVDPWLPVNDDYETRNVQVQSGGSWSILEQYRHLLELKRDQGALQFGNIQYAFTNENIFSFIREWEGHDRLLIAMNFGTTASTTNYRSSHHLVDDTAVVEFISRPEVDYNIGSEVDTDRITLQSGEGIILSWDYER